MDLPVEAEQAAHAIAERAAKLAGRPGFLWERSVVKSPAWYEKVSRRLREQHPDAAIEIVDPYTFFGLIRLHLSQRSE
jgi:hypothetical protein